MTMILLMSAEAASSPLGLLGDAKFWVAAGLIIFLGIVIYAKVPGLIAKMLDERSAAIRKEIEEARRLREEAQALHATYLRKAKDAEREADEIIATAKAEAERMQVETRAQIEALIQRRAKLAEDKIAQAEAQAMAEVKAAAADAAVAAAGRLLGERVGQARASDFTDEAIKGLRAKLN